MNNNAIIAGNITNKQKALGYILLFPSYLYYIPKIVTFLLFFINAPVTEGEKLDALAILNMAIGVVSLVMAIFIFKDFIIENIRAFKKTLIEDSIWSCSVGIGITYGVAIVSNLAVIFLLAVFGQEQADSSNQIAVGMLLNKAPLMMSLQAVIIAPILEEILYRGLLFRGLYEKNRKLAHFISAFLFGFSHVYSGLFSGDWTQIIHLIPYMSMGFAFSYAYQKRGNICVPILVHMLNNLIATLVLFLT